MTLTSSEQNTAHDLAAGAARTGSGSSMAATWTAMTGS